LALQIFHYDKAFSFGFSYFVDTANVRVIQSRSGSRFSDKALAGRFVLLEEFGKKFYRNL
jgi:hypothetical protein